MSADLGIGSSAGVIHLHTSAASSEAATKQGEIMKTNGNTLELHPSLALELDAEIYGKHAQGKYPEQVSVWELCSSYEGKHRK